MMFCDMLAHVSTRRCFKSQTVSCTRVPVLSHKFGSQPDLCVVSFQFIGTFDQNFVHAEQHYLQTPSDVNIASLPSLLFKNK